MYIDYTSLCLALGLTEELLNGTCGLYSLTLGVDG